MSDTANQIKARFSEMGIKVSASEIDKRLGVLEKFKVPPEEARRSVVTYFLKEHNVPRGEFYKNESIIPDARVADIKQDGKWVNLKVRVVQLWEKNHDSISQVGLIGDETGTIKFTKWASAGLPDVAEGKTYEFRNVVTSEYQGRFQVTLNRTSVITELALDIEVGSTQTEFSGAIVDIQSGSGLIKRCPECNRALVKGVCGEHGKVEGNYDLRIKAVIDNGSIVQDALMNREVTEKLTGITLDKAREIATESLDPSIVTETIRTLLVGRYYTVRGRKLDTTLLVETIEPMPAVLEEDIAALVAEAEVA